MITHAGQDVSSPLVNVTHHDDLLALLVEVALVDADGIHPVVPALAVPEGLCQDKLAVPPDWKGLFIDLHQRFTVVFPPCVGNCVIRWEGLRVCWPCREPAPDTGGLGMTVVVQGFQKSRVPGKVWKRIVLE